MSNQLFVSPDDGRWKVKNPDNSRASGIFNTKAEAIERAREIAKKQELELTIQNKNGRIHEKDSYGNDPRNISG